MFTQTKTLPRVLTFSEAKYYIFTVIFTVSAVFFPWLAHQFHIAGQIFLPMHIFILIAGFLFGWRAGLLVGIISPLISYSLTQMPVMALLPQVVLELSVYGLIIGILREKNLNIWLALFSAMILGRLARILFILTFVSKMNALQFVQISWPGIALQLILVPIVIYLLQRFLFKKSETKI